MSHVPQIQAIAENQRRRAYQTEAGANSIAVIVEDYQRYVEYLDELETSPLDNIEKAITVKVDGQTIKFKSDKDFTNWIAEHLT
jgi:hypothetical protein